MNQSDKGSRNLLFLSWLGLACQAGGVLLMLPGAEKLQLGNPLGGPLFLIFGIALAGWASNLREIVDLKQRVSSLEGRSVASSERPREPTDSRDHNGSATRSFLDILSISVFQYVPPGKGES